MNEKRTKGDKAKAALKILVNEYKANRVLSETYIRKSTRQKKEQILPY